MKDLREEVGTKACIVGKIDRCRMKWAGHVVRMKYMINYRKDRRQRSKNVAENEEDDS